VKSTIIKSQLLLLFIVCLFANNANAELFKCTNSNNKITYQATHCRGTDVKSDTITIKSPSSVQEQEIPSSLGGNNTPSTQLVDLKEAAVIQDGPNKSGFVSLTLRAKWANGNPRHVTIYYKTYFYDRANTELYVDSRFRELDANTTSVSPQVLATFEGKGRDQFDYTKINHIGIKYTLKEDETERAIKSVPLKKL